MIEQFSYTEQELQEIERYLFPPERKEPLLPHLVYDSLPIFTATWKEKLHYLVRLALKDDGDKGKTRRMRRDIIEAGIKAGQGWVKFIERALKDGTLPDDETTRTYKEKTEELLKSLTPAKKKKKGWAPGDLENPEWHFLLTVLLSLFDNINREPQYMFEGPIVKNRRCVHYILACLGPLRKVRPDLPTPTGASLRWSVNQIRAEEIQQTRDVFKKDIAF